MTKRRTKTEMNWMREEVEQWLLKNNNDPHKAWDAYIKYHLENKMLLVYYIKGIKDFNLVSDELAKEMEKERQEKEQKEMLKQNKENLINELKGLAKEDASTLWKYNKNKLNESDKIILVDLVNMIMHQEYWIEEKHIRLYSKLELQPV